MIDSEKITSYLRDRKFIVEIKEIEYIEKDRLINDLLG
jgi:hypothetical protein